MTTTDMATTTTMTTIPILDKVVEIMEPVTMVALVGRVRVTVVNGVLVATDILCGASGT
jgi:hypothetical protein